MAINQKEGVGHICATDDCRCLCTTEADAPLCQRCADGRPAEYIGASQTSPATARGKWVPLDSQKDSGGR